MCKVQTGEWAILCWMLLALTQTYGKCFVLPIVVHQANILYQYIYFNIPLEWIFHHPPSRYNHLLTFIPEYIISTKISICHLSPVSFLSLQSYHDMGFIFLQPCLLRNPFMDVRKTSSHHNLLQKTITTAAAIHDIFPFQIFTSLFHSISHPTNRAFTISLVNPK